MNVNKVNNQPNFKGAYANFDRFGQEWSNLLKKGATTAIDDIGDEFTKATTKKGLFLASEQAEFPLGEGSVLKYDLTHLPVILTNKEAEMFEATKSNPEEQKNFFNTLFKGFIDFKNTIESKNI